MSLYEYLAYTGATLFAFHMIPQIIKISKSRSAKDISYICLFINIISMCLLSIYGYNKDVKSLYLTTGMSLINAMCVVFVKFFYDKFDQYDIDTAI